MSYNNICTLKAEVNKAIKGVNSTESSLKSVEGAISYALDDRVGDSARESITGIRNSFSSSLNYGYDYMSKAIDSLEKGYSKIDELLNNSKGLLDQSTKIKEELIKL